MNFAKRHAGSKGRNRQRLSDLIRKYKLSGGVRKKERPRRPRALLLKLVGSVFSPAC
jgi:hypothetical protein